MGSAANRSARRKMARKRIDRLFTDPGRHNVVHYSCESFYDNPGGGSRRVTSIAILNVGSGQTRTFSIHQTAEREKVALGNIDQQYDVIEKAMLRGFYQYVRDRPDDIWVHWNMRDSNYGFPAIEHRFEVLGGTPARIPESHLFDLGEALPDIFGDEYMEHGKHGRLECLMRFNGFKPRDFLTGKEESNAFVNGEYVKLHQSTLRKARLIHALAERTWDGRLLTQAKWWQRHGASVGGIVEDAADHWAFKLLGAVALAWAIGVIISSLVDIL